MDLVIKNKTYTPCFGIGVIRGICRLYNIPKLSGFYGLIQKLGFENVQDEPTWDQLDFMANCIICSIKSKELDIDIVTEWILKNLDEFSKFFELFMASLQMSFQEESSDKIKKKK